MNKKFSRTFHLPQSPGTTSDDKKHQNIDHILGQYGTITEKRDGENLSMNNKTMWARSPTSEGGYFKSRVSQIHHSIKHDIPDNMRICGENLQFAHSIEYELKTPFEVFAIFYNGIKIPYSDALEWCNLLGLVHVPVLYHGIITEKVIADIIKSLDYSKQEGFVISLDSFNEDDYSNNTAKYVRENHVTTDEHWKRNPKENKFI